MTEINTFDDDLVTFSVDMTMLCRESMSPLMTNHQSSNIIYDMIKSSIEQKPYNIWIPAKTYARLNGLKPTPRK